MHLWEVQKVSLECWRCESRNRCGSRGPWSPALQHEQGKGNLPSQLCFSPEQPGELGRAKAEAKPGLGLQGEMP